MMHKMYKNILYEISLKKRYSFGFCSYIKNKKQFKLTEKVVVSSLSLMWCLYPYGAAHLSHGSNNLRLIWRFYCKSGLQQRSKDQFLFVFIQFCMIVFIFVVFILLVKGFWDDEAQQMRKQKDVLLDSLSLKLCYVISTAFEFFSRHRIIIIHVSKG